MVAHSAENSYNVKTIANALHGWRNITKPRVFSSIAGQWLIPTTSALLLLSADVQHFHPFKSDTETCLPYTAITPMSIETIEPCSHQEDISNYIKEIMNNHNDSLAHNQAAINKHKQDVINNTDTISNKTSLIVDKIYNIVLGSLTSLDQSEEKKHYHFNSFSTVSTIRNHRSVGENNSTFPQFSNMEDEPEENNYYNKEDDPSYYSITNEDHGNRNKTAFEYPNYETSDADISISSTETLYHVLNTDEVTDKPNKNSIPPTHNQQDQQFEKHTETSDMTEIADTVINSSHSPQAQQIKSNFSTVKINTSPTTTSQSLLISSEDMSSSSSITEESIIPVTASIESSNSLSLPNEGTEAISQTSRGDEELTTTTNKLVFQQQTETSAEYATESPITSTIRPSTESQIITQTGADLTHIQIPDTVNMCVVKCYFSSSFLKRYLFVLLFLSYFVPVLASLVIYVATDKNLTMIQSLEVKPSKEPTTTAEQDNTEIACNMHLARMVSASNTVKHLITTITLLWTPILVETLLRVWFCFNTPKWLTTLLFVLGQASTIIRNALNLQMVRNHACSGTVQPLEVEQGTNRGIPTKLFTKAKAVFSKEHC